MFNNDHEISAHSVKTYTENAEGRGGPLRPFLSERNVRFDFSDDISSFYYFLISSKKIYIYCYCITDNCLAHFVPSYNVLVQLLLLAPLQLRMIDFLFYYHSIGRFKK